MSRKLPLLNLILFVSIVVNIYFLFLYREDKRTSYKQTSTFGDVRTAIIRTEEPVQPSHINIVEKVINKIVAVESITNFTRHPDCEKLFVRNFWELAYATDYMRINPYTPKTSRQFIADTSDCTAYKQKRGHPSVPGSQEEANFPIAYVIVAYTDLEQLERMLRLIYAPQNYYCIHIDQKSTVEYFKAMESIAGCFENVILSSARYDVGWGKWTQMQANMRCMQDLLEPRYWKKWKYLINLTGHEFPMKNNYEMVKILKAYNGSNDFAGTKAEGERNRARIKYSKKIPYGLQYVKGEIHGILSKNFVHYLFNHPIALEVTALLANYSVHPDEGLFNTLHYNNESMAPGGYLGSDEHARKHWSYFWPVRYKHWAPANTLALMPYAGPGCRYSMDHGMCKFGIEELKYLRKYARKHVFIFINKIRNTQSLVFDCLEQDFLNHAKNIHSKPLTFDLNSVAELAVVKYGRHNGIDDNYP